MKNIGFLFDLDGVLIDSEKEYTRIWTEINEKFPSGKDNLAYIIKGQTLKKIMDDNYPAAEIREKVTSELHRLEKDLTYEYCEEAESFLFELKKRNAKIAIVTSSDEVKMNHLLENIPEFKDKYEVLIDASKVRKSKPDPEGYLNGAKELNVPINKCVVFEDSVQGVMAGKASGAYVIGITGTKERAQLEPYADIVIDKLNEVDLDKLIITLKSR